MFLENTENTSSAGVNGWKEAGRTKSRESQPVDRPGHGKSPVLVPEFLGKCLSYDLVFKPVWSPWLSHTLQPIGMGLTGRLVPEETKIPSHWFLVHFYHLSGSEQLLCDMWLHIHFCFLQILCHSESPWEGHSSSCSSQLASTSAPTALHSPSLKGNPTLLPVLMTPTPKDS